MWRPATGEWLIQHPDTGVVRTVAWGAPGDIPVPGDYDGDGRMDLAVWRPSVGAWLILRSSDSGVSTVGWGAPGDVPLPGDYDGDGKADPAVYRPLPDFPGP